MPQERPVGVGSETGDSDDGDKDGRQVADKGLSLGYWWRRGQVAMESLAATPALLRALPVPSPS